MCLLIVLRGMFATHPVLVASNRDERIDRKASPPGLWVGGRERVLSPRDREKGGTWIGVNARGTFAGLTNVQGVPVPMGATTRGVLPHVALERSDLDAGIEAVREIVGAQPFGGFQLVLADAHRTVVLRHDTKGLATIEWSDEVLVVTNEHAPGQLRLPDMNEALVRRATPEAQLQALRPLLLDRGGEGRHPVLKRAQGYGTVSSSLLAVPANDPMQLQWWFAAGAPDVVEYRNYGNLARRLFD
ncbi:MAG: NRDE family protein [Planctomycetota bacterium]